MTSSIEPRPVQTKVKHSILEKYLKAWGGIILMGLRLKKPDVHFIYVDCNTSHGRFTGDIEDVEAGREPQLVYGSPIIGIQALDSLVETAHQYGIRLRVSAILVEKKSVEYNNLKYSLDLAGFFHRVKETDDFDSLRNGDVAIVRADSTTVARQIVNYTQSGKKFSLYFLDPYGPKGIPLRYVHSIISRPRHDVIINMPYQDLHKKIGVVNKGLTSTAEQLIIRNYDEMFGHEKWQDIVRSQNNGDYSASELKLMNCYRQSLQSANPSLAVKSIGLRFSDRERTMFYLYLTTHDPTGALQMNRLLWDAHLQEHELRWRLRDTRSQAPGQLAMFELPTPAPQIDPRPSVDEIASEITRKLRARTLPRRDIYREFADDPYFASEIDKALSELKKKGRVQYTPPLNNSTIVIIK